MISRIEPDSGHIVLLVTSPQVFGPVREHWIDSSERDEQPVSSLPALSCQSQIDSADIAVKQCFETSRPGSVDSELAETVSHFVRIVPVHLAEGPAEKRHIHIYRSIRPFIKFRV